MSTPLPITTLPGWAVQAIAKSDINVLIDRCEFETIVMTRQGRADLVLVSHAEWSKLIALAKNVGRSREQRRTQTNGETDATRD